MHTRSLFRLLAACLGLWAPQAWPAWGQGAGVHVRVRFGTDTVAVGQPIALTLEVTHPAGSQVVAPDEARQFGHWAVLAKQPAETEAEGQGLRTRLTYTLATFEVGRIQHVALAPCVLLGTDTLCPTPDTARVMLSARVTRTGPEVAYRAHTDLYPVRFPINWAFWGLVAGLALAVGALAALLLRRPYMRWRARRRLAAHYAHLTAQLQQLAAQPTPTPQWVAAVNALWRSYLGQAWGVPLHALATPELAQVLAQAQRANPALPPTQPLLQLAQAEDHLHFAQRPLPAAPLQALLPALQPLLHHAFTLNLSRLP